MDPAIRRASVADKPEWLRMRLLLWPREDLEGLRAGMDELLEDPSAVIFVVVRPDGKLGGFIEAGQRKYVDGCETSPVGYLEGWFVDEDLRGRGWGARLVQAAEDWARSLGLQEMGSDTWLEDDVSIKAHLALGYQETDRLVHFAKRL